MHLVGGFVLLYLGGEALVRGAARLALGLGVAPLAVGLTVVAFGTSTPELAVTLRAALDGVEGVAVGNVVGSNICNVGLILGIAALIRPIRIHAQLVRLDTPILLGCSLLLMAVLADGRMGRLAGAAFVAGIALYTGFNLRKARREQEPVQNELASAAPGRPSKLPRDVPLVLAGLLALTVGGTLFVRGAVELAGFLGASPALIGLTVVAVGTSLPELATSVIASLRNQGDIAVGNVLGSNVFNILAICGITSLVHPLGRGEVSGWDLGVMTALVVLLWPLLHSGLRLSRAEGGFLLAAYAAYVGWRVAV